MQQKKSIAKVLYKILLRGAREVSRWPGGELLLQQPLDIRLVGQMIETNISEVEARQGVRLPPVAASLSPASPHVSGKEIADHIRLCFRDRGRCDEQEAISRAVDDGFEAVMSLNQQMALQRASSFAETNSVRIVATPMHTPAVPSSPQRPYSFVYRIRIENAGAVPVQVVGRHWIITDETGRVVDVVEKGSVGVVGHAPRLDPGRCCIYMSRANLPTPRGAMEGSFQVEREGGPPFDAEVTRFHLVAD